MPRLSNSVVVFSILWILPICVFAQDEITVISFDEIPEGTTLQGAGSVAIQANAVVAGDVVASGALEAGTGVRYPDGSLQTTANAASSGQGITANHGLYSNRIPDMAPPNAYTEVCFKGGAVQSDIHAGGDSTSGGGCEPGDTGWIIERFERTAVSWTVAKAECLMDGLRLLEPFEWQFSCMDTASLAIDSMTDGWEWASNSASGHSLEFGIVSSVATSILGQGGCGFAAHAAVGRSDGVQPNHPFRCAR